MKYFYAFFLWLCLATVAVAQVNVAGNYQITGYFFHPTSPRAISNAKTIQQIGTNKYQAFLGDLGPQGYSFSFEVDASYKLINWQPVNSTPTSPSSNFMTSDNPGGVPYTVTPLPGDVPWVHNTYNNTYDPATKTFYMHYGYGVGSTDETGFSRQVYEKWVYVTPPSITSFSPLTGTTGTPITIKGRGFSDISDTYAGVSFGNAPADSIEVVSDSLVVAWVGAGASGKVSVSAKTGKDSLGGFTYIPLPAITNSGWSYVGNAGFSANYVSNASIVINPTNNQSYVAYVDTTDHKAYVMKYVGGIWTKVGGAVSADACTTPKLLFNKTGVPYVSYLDSAVYNTLYLKQFDGTDWVEIGNTILDNLSLSNGGTGQYPYTADVDGDNNFYLVFTDSQGTLNALKFDGVYVAQLGTPSFANVNFGFTDLVVDKKTNTPYVVFDDKDNNGLGSVMKFDGSDWTYFSTPGFSLGSTGIWYSKITLDTSSYPIVIFQDDNGFERASVYAYNGTDWNVVGYEYFSQSHIYNPSIAIDKNNKIHTLYNDATYNRQGTVMTFADTTGWKPAGARGFIPFASYLDRDALAIDQSNTPMVAFSDKTKGGKLSVLKFNITVVPLKLIAFQAYAKGNDAQLIWQTTNQVQSAYFNVQRSLDGKVFSNVGRVAMKEGIVNNYQFTDRDAANRSTFYYRLQMVDADGSSTFSTPVAVRFAQKGSKITLYPNPAKYQLQLATHAAQPAMAIVRILDLQGKTYSEQTRSLVAGSNTIPVNISQLPKGNYVLLMVADGVTYRQLFMKE